MAEDKKYYTLEEVKKHNKYNDLWMVLYGKVYDVTKFVEDHPGGSEVLMDVAGTDGTTHFEDVGHSQSAKDMLKEYYIGDLDATSVPAKKEAAKPSTPAKKPEQSSSSLLSYVVAAIAIGLIAYFVLNRGS